MFPNQTISYRLSTAGEMVCRNVLLPMLPNYEPENMRNADAVGIDLSSALVVSKTVGLNDRFVLCLVGDAGY